MSDSDMDIDDDEVQVHVKHTIAGESELLGRPIGASNSQNDLKKHSDEQSKMTKDSCGSFENPQLSGYSGKNIMVGDEKGASLSRFPAPGSITAINFPSGNVPEQKRAAHLCKFFAKGWCSKGNSCRFIHVNNIAGSSITPSLEERRTLDIKEGVRVSLLSENGVTSLHTRDNIHLGNPPACQRVFPPMNEMRLMPSSENIARESLRQNCGADVTENRSLFINNTINSFALRSSFVHDHRPASITSYRKADMESSSAPAWTGSGFTSVPMNEYASNLGHFENRTNTYGSGSLATLQAVPVSSGEDAEGNTCSDKKKVSSNDWEPSEPFKASFTIPPYILPSSDALYDPFTDVEDPEDRSLNAPLSSKGKHARNNPRLQKDGDTSSSGPQARGSNNDDKNSLCSQNQHQETGARKKLDAYGVVEGVATSVVDQNDAATPSKEISSSAAAENRAVLKRCKAAGHESWRRSDGSSHQKMLKSDEIDGEVRSDAGAKVMRQFRTAVVETIKEMLKPLWREGRFTKDVHNMIVKRAAEKIVSAAVQFHQVPTDTVSVEQYLSMSSTKIVKLVEGYVDRYGKP